MKTKKSAKPKTVESTLDAKVYNFPIVVHVRYTGKVEHFPSKDKVREYVEEALAFRNDVKVPGKGLYLEDLQVGRFRCNDVAYMIEMKGKGRHDKG